MHERDVVVATEEIDDLLYLAGAQQAGVDKDAGQLVADRLVQQHRRDGGIDPAREAADDISIADLTTNFVDRLGAKPRHCPVAAAARKLMSEVAQQLGALGSMCNLGMENGAVKAPVVVSDRGIGCGLARGNRTETRRQRVDPVAMAHPHLLARALRPQSVEQQAVVEDIDKGATELLMLASGNSAAQFIANRLHDVADPEHRDTEPKDEFRRARRSALGQRRGAAGQDDRARREVTDLVFADRVRVDLAIDPALAHPARDQLGHLAAEIEDQDAVGHGWRSKMATKKPSVPWRAGVSRR